MLEAIRPGGSAEMRQRIETMKIQWKAEDDARLAQWKREDEEGLWLPRPLRVLRFFFRRNW
jgi:hypothetical protein